MLNRLWIWAGRVPKAEGPAASDLVKGLMLVDERSRVAVMVLALGPRLRERLDLAECLRLAVVGDLAPEAAERLGDALSELAGEREARLVETLRRLSGQMELNRVSAYRWSAEDRRRLFDADYLARRCAGDPLLAQLHDAVWSQGVERLRRAGENPARVALDAMGYRTADDAEAACRPR
ncbi:hypothetical protein GGE65_006514 [Skermanella aerolata]|uniref:Uncharacterized protein n=1 Tax=Skermanella aerolata TaxID=393310 RepID=A0A512DWQ0_9PROT|nr:hypothetical protein [Skermanella aerolata]KJB93780.1 hypothetical protein N826_14145 [Skermanella aerolata KACC 11604]GEO40891.1 hypothetical protein SAE02_50390 [Skermanella aerolata]